MIRLELDIQLFAASATITNARQGDYSIENNNETQRLTFTVKRTSGSTYWQDKKTLTFRLTYNNDDGTTTTLTQSIQFNFPSGSVGATKSASVDFTVPHKTDGTQSISYEASIATGTGAGTLHPTGSATLDTIPRASSITVNDANIGSATNIVINKASSNFTTTLYYKASGQNSWTKIVDKTSNQVYGWTVPTSFYSLIPSSKTIACQFYAETYSGSTLIGTSSTVTATFTATGNPIINSCLLESIDSTTINLVGSNRMIRYVSTVRATVNASGINSASIHSIVVNGVTANGSGVATFPNATTYSYNVTVTDSRGYTLQGTYSITWTNYIPLTLNATIKRNEPTDGIINITYNGNYFNGSFRTSSDTYVANTLSVQYRVRPKDSSWTDWRALSPTIPSGSNSYSQTNYQISGYSYTGQYEFEIQATDRVQNTLITGITVSKGQPVYWWNENSFNTTTDANIGGRLYLSGNGMQDYHEAGFVHDQYGNWKHRRNNSSDNWSIQDSNGTNKFTVYPETGDVSTGGYVSSPVLNNYYGRSYDNVNANDFTENGVYYLRLGCSNVPTSYFYLIVVRAGYSGSADMIQFGFDANCIMYARFKNGNTWGSWFYFSHN